MSSTYWGMQTLVSCPSHLPYVPLRGLAQCMRQHPDEFRDYFRQDRGLATRMRHSEVMVLAHEENGSDMELLERWKHGDPVEPVRCTTTACAPRRDGRR